MGAYSFLPCSLAIILLVIIHVEAKDHNGLGTSPYTSKASLVLPLYHRDSQASPLKKKMEMQGELSKEEKLVGMVRRDAARFQTLSTQIGRVTKEERKEGNHHDHVQAHASMEQAITETAPVSNGSLDGSGEFFTTLGIGYREFSLIMDTGSDLVWIQCLPCESCYAQTDPFFDSTLSHNFSTVSCDNCSQSDIMTCRRQACEYQQSYGDGSFTRGRIVRDSFYINNTTVGDGGIVMGCGHDNEGLFVGAAGLLGLGRGPLSFPSQIAEHTGGMLSYCLSSTGPGALIFGQIDEEGESGENRVYIPLLRNPRAELTFYYVPLVGISIEGRMVEGINASSFLLGQSGRGGVIVDTGTTITMFVEGVYNPMRDAFRAAANMRGFRSTGSFSIFDTCFFAPPQSETAIPSIELHFEGGSVIPLGHQNSMFRVGDGLPLLCLAFASTTTDFSVLGNILQQGFLITFDTQASRVGFLHDQCPLPT